jgi:hypothetical protein
MTRRLIGFVAVLALACGGWLWGSPYLVVAQLKKAAEARDLDAISAKVDFPAVRADLKAQLRGKLARDKSALGSLGAALAERFGDPVVDAAVTPEGMRTIFASAGAAQIARPGQAKAGGMRVRRDGIGRFALVPIHGSGPELGFALEGLTWRVTSVRLPEKGLLGLR